MRTGEISTRGLRRLHDVMERHIQQGDAPGIVTLVGREGRVSIDAVGTLEAGGGQPMRPDTIFRISSMTKPLVAAAAMILVEKGKLRLDEPVDRLLPELADRRVLSRIDGRLDETVAARRPITLRDLLTFTLGIGILMAPPGTYPIQRAIDELELGQGIPRPSVPPAPEEWIRRLGTLPLMSQPGERWIYNTGADVLGVLIARAAGQPLERFLSEYLLEPLGMKDTGFFVPPDQIERLAASYLTDAGTGALILYDEAKGGWWSKAPAFPSGAAGLVSTAEDIAAFGQMMLDGGKHGGRGVLSPFSVRAMTTDHLTRRQKSASDFAPGFWEGHGWGLGMAVLSARDGQGRNAGSYGWDGGLGTSWYSDPKEGLIGVLMTQAAWTSPVPPGVCRDFWGEVYRLIRD